jgi:hypothetical protein
MTTTIIHAEAPYFRAYSHVVNDFLPFGILTTANEFYTKDLEGKSIRAEGVEIDFFLGRFCEDGTPIYENDIVEIATMNEFGSAVLDTAVVRFDTQQLAYFLESDSMKDAEMPLPTKIIRVIGHNHGHK